MCMNASALMSTNGLQGLQAGATIFEGLSRRSYSRAQADELDRQAAGERDTGVAQAERILRAAKRERGAARAATAASGAAINEFSLIAEDEIQRGAESDAAMAILTGNRRARSLGRSADSLRDAGGNALAGSILSASADAYRGWRGAKKPDTGGLWS